MQEFLDFLAKNTPFSGLAAADLERVAASLDVEYFNANYQVVTAGTTPLDHLYLIRAGAVDVMDKGRVIDQLGPGDAFGHISVLTGLPPEYSVRTTEETLCYRLPDPRKIVAQPGALAFGYFGTFNTRRRITSSALMSDAQAPVTRYMRNIVWVDSFESIQRAAELMSAADSSCAVIKTHNREIGYGLVTDRDFRSKLATGKISSDDPISAMMSHPLITIDSRATLTSAFMYMVERGVHHLVVVDEIGTPIGVVRAMDLSSVQLRNPLLVRSAIESARDIKELQDASALLRPALIELHDNQIPSLHIAGLMSAMISATLSRVIQLSPDLLAPVEHSWLILGSVARGEPLPASDVDTAIVWADQSSGSDISDQVTSSAAAILKVMESCGLSKCPNGANADNTLFTRSKQAWSEVSSAWLSDPTRAGALLLSSIAADNQPITNVALGRTIMESLRESTRSRAYISDALRFALAKHPPVGFVREFIVEHGGEHKGELNLKEGGIAPIVSLARWMAIALGDVRGGTIDRLKRADSAGFLRGDECEILIGAFTELHQLVFENEIVEVSEGRKPNTWVSPHDLDSLTRRHLRETFRAVSAIQSTFESDWSKRLP